MKRLSLSFMLLIVLTLGLGYFTLESLQWAFEGLTKEINSTLIHLRIAPSMVALYITLSLALVILSVLLNKELCWCNLKKVSRNFLVGLVVGEIISLILSIFIFLSAYGFEFFFSLNPLHAGAGDAIWDYKSIGFCTGLMAGPMVGLVLSACFCLDLLDLEFLVGDSRSINK